jgi:DNA adenine methylase
MFRRLGNKNAIAPLIYPLFPKHSVYYEPFFGVGGMYFQKPKSKYALLNDLNSEVMNLFLIIKDQKEDLLEILSITPLSEELFNYWKVNNEIDNLHRALRFLYLSSFSLYGKGDTFRLMHSDASYKSKLNKLVVTASAFLQNTVLSNKDHKSFVQDFAVSESHIPARKRFIYNDPPYVGTCQNYNLPTWQLEDLYNLINNCIETTIPFAVSEFKNEQTVAIAKELNLDIINITESYNMGKPETEILMINYDLQVDPPQTSFNFKNIS